MQVAAVLVWSILIAPFGMGAYGLRRMESFRREAFGNYRASTFYMMAAIVAGLGYYALVLAAFQRLGVVGQMTQWPLSLAAVCLYLQSVCAVAALAFVVASGRAAWRVTKPGPLAPQP